jgi:arylsulfatase A-like enzyme
VDWSRASAPWRFKRSRGYRTGAFSANTFWFTRAHGFGRGFLHFDDFFHSLADMAMRTAYGRMAVRLLRRPLGWNDIVARRRAPSTNRAVVRWLEADGERPFFVVINYMDVHDPYLPPEPYRSRFSKRPQPGGLINWELRVPDALTPDELQGEVDAYDGAIAYVDEQIGDLLASDRFQDSARDLLVVVTSDHGEEFMEHGGLLHGSHLYRETIQVPMILWRPGAIPRGVRVPTPVSIASIPVLYDLTTDPGETTNLAAEPRAQALVQWFREHLAMGTTAGTTSS